MSAPTSSAPTSSGGTPQAGGGQTRTISSLGSVVASGVVVSPTARSGKWLLLSPAPSGELVMAPTPTTTAITRTAMPPTTATVTGRRGRAPGAERCAEALRGSSWRPSWLGPGRPAPASSTSPWRITAKLRMDGRADGSSARAREATADRATAPGAGASPDSSRMSVPTAATSTAAAGRRASGSAPTVASANPHNRAPPSAVVNTWSAVTRPWVVPCWCRSAKVAASEAATRVAWAGSRPSDVHSASVPPPTKAVRSTAPPSSRSSAATSSTTPGWTCRPRQAASWRSRAALGPGPACLTTTRRPPWMARQVPCAMETS